MLRTLITAIAVLIGSRAGALDRSAEFASIDGGGLTLAQWDGQPILVVNTASQCGYTHQYSGLQSLYDRYRDQGLVVLAVPSDDFKQELSSNSEVKNFCEMQFGLDIPMTEITSVRGTSAHPFYASLRAETGFVPRWNFNKVLIGPDGAVVETYGSNVRPLSPSLTEQIEALLN